MRKFPYTILKIVFLLSMLVIFASCNKPDPYEIKVDQPLKGDILSSPVSISGQARGAWYFEATFPVYLLGPDGSKIAGGFVTAKSDWMTTEMVPFEGKLDFETEYIEGKLVLRADNPSGLSVNDKEYVLPVKFSHKNE